MSIQAVILDLGNVLVWHANALLFERLGQRAGKDAAWVSKVLLGPGWLSANRGELDAEGIRRMVCEAIGADLPADEFSALWSSHFTVHQEVLPLVESLVGRTKLLLLSNTNVLHAAFVRPKLPILEKFDHVLLSCELGLVKPQPEIFREALERAGTAPSDTVFFDDQPEFVEAARSVGIQSRQFSDAPTFASQLRMLGL